MDGYNESLLDKMKCKNKVAATKSLHNNMLENIHLGLDIKLEPSDNEDACENKKFCSENVQFIKVEPKILHSNKLQNNHLGVDIKLEPCDNDNGIKTESTEFHYINKEQEDDEYKQQTSVIDHEKYLENVSEIEETKLKAEQQSNPFIVPECVYSLTGVQENDTTIKTDLLVQTDILIDENATDIMHCALKNMGSARRRCIVCYEQLKLEKGRNFATSRCKQTAYKCGKCKSYFCIECFFLKHKSFRM